MEIRDVFCSSLFSWASFEQFAGSVCRQVALVKGRGGNSSIRTEFGVQLGSAVRRTGLQSQFRASF